MRTDIAILAAATLLAVLAAPAAAGAPAATPPPADAAIVVHSGVPGVVYLGQPLSEFIARFPGAASTPFAGQNEVVRLQVAKEGLSALAMGTTPASMTIESIGFNFGGEYEGVKATRRRTAEGIGSGSTVNDLLGAYGRPAETAPEGRRGTPAPQAPAPDRKAPVRYLYRSADATIATYFVVEGSLVTRMAMSRPASVERWLMKRPAPGPGTPGGDRAPGEAPAAPPDPPAAPTQGGAN